MSMLSKTQAIVGFVTLALVGVLGLSQPPALAAEPMPIVNELLPVPTVDSPVVIAPVYYHGTFNPRGGLFTGPAVRCLPAFRECVPYDPVTYAGLPWSVPSRLSIYQPVRGFPRYDKMDRLFWRHWLWPYAW